MAEEEKFKGNRLFKDRKYDEASVCYLKAIDLAMENGQKDLFHTIWCNLAHVNNKIGKHKESEKYARLAIQSKPGWYKGYYRAAEAAAHLGRLQDALALLNKGIVNSTDSDQLRQLRASLMESPRNHPTKTQQSTMAKKKTAAAPPPPPPPLVTTEVPRQTAEPPAPDRPNVWSRILSDVKPASQLSDSQAAAARDGDPEALRQELCVTVRRGSAALRRDGGARQAYEEYRRALQIVATHGQKLKSTAAELISLRYCFALACHEVASLETLQSAETELLILLEKTPKPVPAAFYLLGKVYLSLKRFEPARQALSRCSQMLDRGAMGETHVFPGTSDTVSDTEWAHSGQLQLEVEALLKLCRCPPPPDARCRLPDCLCLITVPSANNLFQSVQVTRSDIYYSDVDFSGFVTVQCLDKCQLEYHLNCWRKLKEEFGPETQRTKDKDLLDTPCRTPDCGADICRICTIGADTLERHELTSEQYRQRQQRPQPRQTRQQKKAAAAQPPKKQAAKTRKPRDLEGRRNSCRKDDDPGPQKSASDPALAAPPETASDAAAPASTGTVAPPVLTAPQPGSVPDLREMTMLKRDSDGPEIPKKSKKKRRGAPRRRRGAELSIWGAPEEEQVYNGPPVNVIYSTDESDLTSRLSQLDEKRTLQFSTRDLIPDSSQQSTEVPRCNDVSREDHTILESAYQFLYDYIKSTGPISPRDSNLLAITSELSGHMQHLITEHGSLEDFLLRVPRFFMMDGLVCVDTDVPAAETMVRSGVSELLGLPVLPVGSAGGCSGTSPEGEMFRSDPVTGELLESDEEGPPLEPSPCGVEHRTTADADVSAKANYSKDTNDSHKDAGSVPKDNISVQNPALASKGTRPPWEDLDPDSADWELDSADSVSNLTDVDQESVDLDVALTDSEYESVDTDRDTRDLNPERRGTVSDTPDEDGDDSEQKHEGKSTSGEAADRGRGDGAWKEHVKGEASVSSPSLLQPSIEQSGPWQHLCTAQPAPDQLQPPPDQLQLLQSQLKQLREQQAASASELRAARITKLRLERTVRQLTQADAADSPVAALQTQLDETRTQLAEQRQQLEQVRQLGADQLKQADAERDQARAELERSRETEARCQQAAEQLNTANQLLLQQSAAQQQQLVEQELKLQEAAAQVETLQHHAMVNEQQIQEMSGQLEAALAWSEHASPETQQQLVEAVARADQLEAELAEARRQAVGAEAARQSERRTLAKYVSLLSNAGVSALDSAARRCADGVLQLQRLPESAELPAQEHIRKLQETENTVEQTRVAFKKVIKTACKAIKNREPVDLKLLSMPSVPDVDAILASAPALRGQGVGDAVAAAMPPPPAQPVRPSSVVTVSCNGSDGDSSASGSLPLTRPVAMRKPAVPAQLASAAPAPSSTNGQASTPFDILVDEIQAACGAGAPRDAVLRQLSVFRGSRGGSLRGLPRPQLVAEVAALVLAELAGNGGSAPVPLPRLQPQPSREECLICREMYTRDQSQQLTCGHRFHELCLRRWKQASGLSAPCPICRKPFTSDSEFPSL